MQKDRRVKETERLDAVALLIAGILLAQVQQTLDARTDLGPAGLRDLSVAADRAQCLARRVLPLGARRR